MAVTFLAVANPVWATTFTVNSTEDTGDTTPDGTCDTCTLREAIQEANANNNDATVVDAIHFRISGAGPHTISPASSLPDITEPVIIDGYTQPGAKANTMAVGDNADLRIRLDGSNAGSVALGLRIVADDSVVRGLSVTRFFSGLIILGTDDNKIEGNFVGIAPRGTQALGSANSIVIGDGSNNNTVGGTSPRARNIISGNDFGVIISGSGSTGNNVQGNYIGTTKDGTGDLGNSAWGVIIGSGASDNQVGGASRAAANIIAFNGETNEDGVGINDAESTGNRILGNSIFSNDDLGIDLELDGPTANDPGDGDTGANSLQNFPLLTSAKVSRRGVTTIKGTLNSTASTTFTVQLFSGPAMDLEGKRFLGQKSVTTDASGNASFTFKTKKKVSKKQEVTATATNPGGDTSEFSAAAPVS
jgi:trimeric autotransporter adhesin